MGIFIGLMIVGLLIGVFIAIPILIVTVGGIVTAQKYARAAIESGKIENTKKAEAVLKMLRASNEGESKYLHDKLSLIVQQKK